MVPKYLRHLILSRETLRQISSTLIVWIVAFLYGMERGWMAPATKHLFSSSSPFVFATKDISWISVAGTTGHILSSFLCGIAGHRIGRKRLYVLTTVMLMLAWTLNLLATSVFALMCSKFLINAACGIHDVIQCFYVSEITSVENRGVLIAIILIFYTSGIESQYVINLAGNYKLLSVVPVIVSVVGFLVTFLTLESPHYLITKGYKEEAWKNIYALHGKYRVNEVYTKLLAYMEEEKEQSSFFKYVLLPENYRMCVCIIVLNSLVYLSSGSQFEEFSQIIMEPFSTTNMDIMLNVLGTTNIVAMLVSPFMVHRFTRKSLTIGGLVLLGLFQIVIAGGFCVEGLYSNTLAYVPEGIVGLALACKVTYAASVYPVIHVLRAEMFPYKVKESGTSLLVILKTFLVGLADGIFFPVGNQFGVGLNFLIYSLCGLVGGVYGYFYLLETKGKTLSQIKDDYKSKV